MSIPNDPIFTPPPKDDPFADRLVDELEEKFQNINTQVNGTFRSNSSDENKAWTPILKGTTTAGAYGYSVQYGTTFRQGLLTDCWGTITWTTSTGAGNLYVELPYKVSSNYSSNFLGTALLTGSASSHAVWAVPGTYRLEVILQGASLSNVNANTTTSSLVFYCRYIGDQDE